MEEVNKLQQSPEWDSTAIVLAYDDSDGWYDHANAVVIGPNDRAQDSDICTGAEAGPGGYADRCGYGPRLPLEVISPFSKVNFVDHTRTDQTSILKFIEDNWSTGRIGDFSYDDRAGDLSNMFDFTGNHRARPLTLDAATGAVVDDKQGTGSAG